MKWTDVIPFSIFPHSFHVPLISSHFLSLLSLLDTFSLIHTVVVSIFKVFILFFCLYKNMILLCKNHNRIMISFEVKASYPSKPLRDTREIERKETHGEHDCWWGRIREIERSHCCIWSMNGSQLRISWRFELNLFNEKRERKKCMQRELNLELHEPMLKLTQNTPLCLLPW